MSHEKGVDQEEEYFHRLDQERLQKMREEAALKEAAEEAQKLRELHLHRCGKCGHAMHTRVFKGLEIEVCDSCSAVLLDPGELEKLVGEDRSGVVRTVAEFFNFTRRKEG